LKSEFYQNQRKQKNAFHKKSEQKNRLSEKLKGKAGFFTLVKNQNKSESKLKNPRNKKTKPNAAKTRFPANQKSAESPKNLP